MVSKIRELCKQNNTSVKALEEELGFGNGAIRRWDTNAPSYDRIEKVANRFNVPVSFFLETSAPYTEDKTTLVERIRFLCSERGVSFNQFEKESGVGRGTAAKWDTNSPSIEKVSKAAEYFNVSVSYLLGEEKEKPTLSGEQISDARKQLDVALDDMSDEELLFLMSKIKAIKDMRK